MDFVFELLSFFFVEGLPNVFNRNVIRAACKLQIVCWISAGLLVMTLVLLRLEIISDLVFKIGFIVTALIFVVSVALLGFVLDRSKASETKLKNV